VHVFILATVCRCSNADPNFGTSWFHCRRHPSDTPIAIVHSAEQLLQHDLVASLPAYRIATQHYIMRCLVKSGRLATDLFDDNPVVSAFVHCGGRVLSASDYLSSFEAMNKINSIGKLSQSKKYEVLFGSDQIIP
jgi:hypothetical protein